MSRPFMSPRLMVACCIATASLVANGVKAQSGASFQGLGLIPGQNQSVAYGVSDDGDVVVGAKNEELSVAFRWTAQGGLTVLPLGGQGSGRADEVSGDGQVTVGRSSVESVGGCTWNGNALGITFGSTAIPIAASADGSVLTGSSGGAARFENGNWVPLGLGGNSGAAAITPDGTAIVGTVGITSGFLWTQSGGTTSLPFFARDVSANGLVVVGKRPPVAGAGAVRWTAKTGMQVLLAQSGIVDPQADCVSADGNLVGISVPSGGARIWDPKNGVRDFKQVLLDEGATGVNGWTLMAIHDMSPDGLNLVGYGLNPAGQFEAWLAKLPPRDSDGDGLFDHWETSGIPYTDANGAEQRYILNDDSDPESDSDPNHKDLWIEVDAMIGLAPQQSAITAVASRFAIAPVSNPDSRPGVTLHVILDETDLPFNGWTLDNIDADPDVEWPTEFDDIKLNAASGTPLPGHFGTVDEREDLDQAEGIREARKKAFRYCIFAKEILFNSSVSGIAELPGNDFIVSLWHWEDGTGTGSHGGTLESRAGTFMHELGHTLGLGHGGTDPFLGPDPIINKPNHYSVMNYLWQTPKSWHVPGSWPLSQFRPGYSDMVMPVLEEGALAECQPLSTFALAGVVFPHNTLNDPNPAVLPVVVNARFDLPIDWDDDGVCSPSPIAVDINRVRDNNAPSLGQTLVSYADWPVLVYDFRDTLSFPDGVHNPDMGAPLDELTFEEDQALETILPPFCLGEVTGDRSVDVDDLLMVISSWGACTQGCVADIVPIGFADGQVNIDDLLAVINAWGPCP